MDKIRYIFRTIGRRYELWVGGAIVLFRFSEWLIGKAGDIEFVMSNWTELSSLINSNWAVSLSIIIGFALIARAIHKTFKRGPKEEKAELQKVLAGRLKSEIEEEFSGKHFYHEQIYLDGRSYNKCHFHGCTYVYNGGKTELIKCHFYGGKIFGTDDPAIESYLMILNEFGLIPVPFVGDEGVLPKPQNIKFVSAAQGNASHRLERVFSNWNELKETLESGIHDTQCVVRGRIEFVPVYTKPLQLRQGRST